MELSESCRQYLTHYYLLEQTRGETHRFLEALSERLSILVEEHLRLKNSGSIAFQKWVKKDGGAVWFTLTIRQDVPRLREISDWKYSVAYKDAMQTQELSSPTHCMILGHTAKSSASQIAETKRVATILGLPDPYRTTELDLVGAPADEVIDNLARAFIGYCDDYARIIEEMGKSKRITGE